MNPTERAQLRAKATANELEYAGHALLRMSQRGIGTVAVREVLAEGEVIEDYPDDKYGPSCLLFAYTAGNRPLHVVCSYPQRPFVKIITAYEPTLAAWLPGFTLRQPK